MIFSDFQSFALLGPSRCMRARNKCKHRSRSCRKKRLPQLFVLWPDGIEKQQVLTVEVSQATRIHKTLCDAMPRGPGKRRRDG